MDKLRYPIGQFNISEEVSLDQVDNFIAQIEAVPKLLADSVKDLSYEQLSSPYRPGGWTIQQVIHHLADSHMNAYIRVKLALTEDFPTIIPFNEALWAELEDARALPVDVSLKLIETLHFRWVFLLRSLSPAELNRQFRHPDAGDLSIRKTTALYAWHGNHHLAHIMNFRKSIGL
ncbi:MULTISPECIES: YfiT family bacillithiol transferase [Desulfosporosinus]|uniref:YfiT family bacillithiol transferase n=1 Tax=Desulfosporosinus TaxID=79206 RepID=UPI00207C2A1A|nr:MULTISPECIES: putative metal-dependent hydrolase [Desulfosporosinus]MCO1604352.1 putative metal-dependent hydrolase [Desulfosporosinus nitroreducens]MCO5386040.1 putative metal-dependent hydrolase [Desulfosporosinus sp.]MDA8220998.1 putative metal-dependent hydrolase [Desulfitobacterium hafniense]